MLQINKINIDKFRKKGNYYYFQVNKYTYLQFNNNLEYIGAIFYINNFADKEVFKCIEKLLSVNYIEYVTEDYE